MSRKSPAETICLTLEEYCQIKYANASAWDRAIRSKKLVTYEEVTRLFKSLSTRQRHSIFSTDVLDALFDQEGTPLEPEEIIEATANITWAWG